MHSARNENDRSLIRTTAAAVAAAAAEAGDFAIVLATASDAVRCGLVDVLEAGIGCDVFDVTRPFYHNAHPVTVCYNIFSKNLTKSCLEITLFQIFLIRQF